MTGGPYREHEPTKPIKAPWWLTPKRWLMATLLSYEVVILAAVTAGPAVVAHAAGQFSWHWPVVHALVGLVTWALIRLLPDGTPLIALLSIVVYIASIVTLGTIAGAKAISGPVACADEAWGPGHMRTCRHPDHNLTRFTHHEEIWVECKCRR